MNKVILGMFFLIIGTSVFAQVDESRKLREDAPRTRRSEKFKRNVENTYAIKFDPIKMFIGELSFSYEGKIDQRSTFEFELGPTISNLRNDLSINNHQYSVYGASVDGSLMGGFGSLAYRFYPLQDGMAMNRFYISPKIKYRNYNYNYADNIYNTLEDKQGKSSEFIFSFNVGTQIWYSNNFAIDYYAGLGMGSVNSTRYNVVSIYDGNTGTYNNSWNKSTDKYARIIGVIGIKVSLGN